MDNCNPSQEHRRIWRGDVKQPGTEKGYGGSTSSISWVRMAANDSSSTVLCDLACSGHTSSRKSCRPSRCGGGSDSSAHLYTSGRRVTRRIISRHHRHSNRICRCSSNWNAERGTQINSTTTDGTPRRPPKAPYTLHSSSFLSGAAGAEEVLPEPSFVFLPRCPAVQAVRTKRKNSKQQEELVNRRGRQREQVQRPHCEERQVAEEQRQEHQQDAELQRTFNEKDGESQLQQQENIHCSSSESSRGGLSSPPDFRGRTTDVWAADDCAEGSNREPDRSHAVHRKKKGWDGEDADDPILADFSSLEQEAFPYPLPCCSLLELLPPDDQSSALSNIQRGEPCPSGEPQEAGDRGNTGILLQLQTDAEQRYYNLSKKRQHLGGERNSQQEGQQDVARHQQEEAKSDIAQSDLQKRIFLNRAYSADTAMYGELLQRHFGDQKNLKVEGISDGCPLPSSFAREYINFQPAPAFDVTELRPQTFRERVAAIQTNIESLSIPPPPRPCPLRFSKFIVHAQTLTSGLETASPHTPVKTPTDAGGTAAAAAAGLASFGATIAAGGMMTADRSPDLASRGRAIGYVSSDAQKDIYASPPYKYYYSSRSVATGVFLPTSSSFSSTALRSVAEYFGFFAVSGVRVPSVEEAVACGVAEELRWWPDFLDAGTTKLLKDVLTHSKARRFNRFPCRIAWPPIPPLCTYSENNLKYSLRGLLKLKTYVLVQNYYHTRFHRETSIHNFAVDQHAIEQRKLAAAEARCRQARLAKMSAETPQPQRQHLHNAEHSTQNRQQKALKSQQKELQVWRSEEEPGRRHSTRTSSSVLKPLRLSGLQRQPEQPGQQNKQHEERMASYAEKANDKANWYNESSFSFSAANLVSGKGTGSRSFGLRAPDFYRRVSKDNAVISVAFYHATRGTKLAAFDVLATQTLLDIRKAFLGCCEAESEPGIPFFPGSCFLIDGILYPDTYHASSCYEYAETIAEHLSGSGKLARKRRDHSSTGSEKTSENHVCSAKSGHVPAGRETQIIRPRKRLDGSLRFGRLAVPQRSSVSTVSHEEQHDEQKNCIYFPGIIGTKSSWIRRQTSYSRDSLQAVGSYEDAGLVEKNTSLQTEREERACAEELLFAPSLTRAQMDDFGSESLEDEGEGNDWIMIPQHKAVLNNMQLPMRSLECFVHQGTCEHRVIFWNIRQFDPHRDCCYAAAYPVRTFKPSSKAVTCQACEEHLACKGVLNSVLCSVHNPTHLCENCYTCLFSGVAGTWDGFRCRSPGHNAGGRASSSAPSDRGGERGESTARNHGTSGAEEGTAGEEDHNPDPFALHFDMYDG